MLRFGGSDRHSAQHIIAYHQLQGGDFPSMLRNEFCWDRIGEGGFGLVVSGDRYSVWYDAAGIHFAQGDTIHVLGAKLVSWEQAAERIDHLLRQGKYQSSAILSKALDWERQEVAAQLWLLHRDLSSMMPPNALLEESFFEGGFPDSTERIANLLKDPEQLITLRGKLAAFTGATAALHLPSYAQPSQLLLRTRKLTHTPLQYPASKFVPEPPDIFLTQDELQWFIRRGPSIENSKQRIQDYFQQEHTPKELAEHLKAVYGHSGYSFGDFYWIDSGSRGFSVRRDGRGRKHDEVRLTWPKMVREVRRLIESGEYLSQPETQPRNKQSEKQVEPVVEVIGAEASEEEPRAGAAQSEESPQSEKTADWIYPREVGSFVYLDGSHLYQIERTTEFDVYLRDMQNPAVSGRVVAQSKFDETLELSPLNAHLKQGNRLSLRDSRTVYKECLYTALVAIRQDAVFNILRSRDLDELTAETALTEHLDNLMEANKELAPELVDAYQTWPNFREWMIEDAFQWTYQDFLADERDAVELHQGRVDAPAWVKGIQISIPQQSIMQPKEELRAGAAQSEEDTEKTRAGAIVTQETLGSTEPEFPFAVGDTVYLEDGKAFVIESIGLFDVHLRDPSLRYPIGRVESKENLLRLVERYPQQTKEEQPSVYTTEQVSFYPAGPNELPYDIVVETLHVEEQEQAPEKTPEPTVSDHNPTPEPVPDDTPANFRITDPHLGEGGPKAKYEANLAAIRVLKQLEAEHRSASPEEQSLLSRYVGWGGVPDAFDSRKAEWSKEYDALKELLTPEEYRAARDSVLNAHYTTPVVIQSVYAALDRLGFQSGRILEPSCGVGNFFGLLPDKMSQSQLYGVELDSISGRIAALLYPDASITVSGFEQTSRPGFYDIAVGNVPFGQYEVNDPAYNHLHFTIHNYFFAKALDQVRPGGLVAFLTSRHTMDSKSTSVRRYLAQRAELVGAIRLPNNAFLANAGTEVTSDILILQRRSEPLTITQEDQWPEWVHADEFANDKDAAITVNRYFTAHPEMVMGTLELKSTQYGYDLTCAPLPDGNLEQQLSAAVERLPQAVYQEAQEAEKIPEVVLSKLEHEDTIPADENVRNFSFTAVDGEIYFRENDVMLRQELSPTAKARTLGLIQLGELVRAVIQAQLDGCSDEALLALQEQLNGRYDEFEKRFGRVNSRENRSAFSNDSTYYLICSLEDYEQGKFVGKSALFTKRTIRQTERVVHCDVPREALAVSLNEKGRVDVPFMARLLDMSETEVTEALAGQIYVLPETLERETPTYVSESEYLSGNIRQKLEAAKNWVEQFPTLSANITALEKAMPERVTAADIEVHLGATWIPVQYLNDFVQQVILSTDGILPWQYRVYYRNNMPEVELSTAGDNPVWNITNKTKDEPFQTNSQEVWGINLRGGRALEILEKTLNLKEITITQKDSEGRSFTNHRATTEARAKQAALQQKFSDWIFEDPERREALEELYNQKFNSVKPREYDGSYMTFPGMSPYLNLRPHQKAAVAHALYGGNTLFAHVVGAGKSAEMIATAMEGKRLGLHHKSLFVVPKHTIEQMAREFVRFYPSANVLVARPADFTAANRKKFCARIAAGDYDAIIMSFSQFERIPVSQERQEEILQAQIDEIIEAQATMEKKSFSLKQMVKMEKTLKQRLEKLQANGRKDDVVTFEELGVDKLFVDEAHYYKNGAKRCA